MLLGNAPAVDGSCHGVAVRAKDWPDCQPGVRPRLIG
jgi:hypothetical protein